VSDEELNLLPLGGLHVGDSSDRFELTKQNFETVDTVFIESVIGGESLWTKLINGFRAPLIVPGALLALKSMAFLTSLTGKGDGKLKQRIVDEYNAEVVEIDKSFHPSINASPYLWPISNYAFLLGVCLLYTMFGGLIFALTTIAYVKIVIFIFYLAATLHGRDSKIALDIEQYAQTHSGNACAIVGGFHEKGMINRLTNSSIVQIVSQDSDHS
jgi:hypothetical protein